MTRSVLVLAFLFSAADVSALEVRVRGESRMEVNLQAAGTVAQVAGRLKDELERGIGHRTVEVRIENVPGGRTVGEERVSTNSLGQFGVQKELPPGEYAVYVTYPRNEHFDGVQELGTVKLEPAPVEANLFGPLVVVGRSQPAFVYGRASTGSIPFQGFANIYVGESSDVIGRLDFDASGRGSLDVVSELQPGENRVRMEIPGSQYRDPVDASFSVRFSPSLEVEARLEERLERLSRGLAIHGRVFDQAGPVAGLRIQSVFLPEGESESPRDAITVSGMTDDAGRFSGFVESHRLGDGTWRGVARVIPPVGERIEVSVPSVKVDSKTSRAILNGIGVAALLLGILVLLSRAIQMLMSRFAAWREARERAVEQRRVMQERETIVPVFLDEPSEIISRSDLGGLVWDVWQSRAVPGATITIEGPGGVRTITSDDRGRFQVKDLPVGTHSIQVARLGFVRGVLEVKIPHSGRLANFRVDLVAVPLKIRRLYQVVLESALGDDHWGRLSPREIQEIFGNILRASEVEELEPTARRDLEDVIARWADFGEGVEDVSAAELLEALTSVVEESYFSGRFYDESIWLTAREIALRLRASATGEVTR